MTKMLTTREVQNLLHVDRSTVYRMAESGRLPAFKVGKQWRFPAEQIETWLQGKATSPLTTVSPEEPAKAADFASLLPLTCVQLIQDSFADALEAMIVITDMAGNPVTEVSNPCGLFEVMRRKPEALQQCIAGWGALASSLDLAPEFAPGHLGLLGTRAFVRCGTELKGMVFIGGVAPEQWPPDEATIAALATELDMPPEALRPHLDEVFYLDDEQRAKALSLAQRIANILAHIIAERVVLTGKLESIAKLVSLS